jgi:hypothetical protein
MVKKRVECVRETCTLAVIHIINTYTITQCTLVFEERCNTKCVNVEGANARPVPVSHDCIML